MLNFLELKKYYNHMYEELRNYLWDFNTVECLADLEVAVYRRFPDIAEVRAKFNRLYSRISSICMEDEYFQEAVNNFKNIINSSDVVYSRIIKPKEA